MFVIWFPFRRFPPSSQTNTIKFLDKAKIKAILINEGITMHRVVFYLAFVVAGRDKMVVAFENLKPRLHILVKIYRCNKSLSFIRSHRSVRDTARTRENNRYLRAHIHTYNIANRRGLCSVGRSSEPTLR